jgi:hypothetical protein
MWMFTTHGMVSVTRVKNSKSLQIRSRERSVLDTLREGYMSSTTAADCPVIKTQLAEHDYQFRIIVPVRVWVEIAVLLAHECQDYENFKGAVLAEQGYTAYERACHEVWQVLADTFGCYGDQPVKPFRGGPHRAWRLEQGTDPTTPIPAPGTAPKGLPAKGSAGKTPKGPAGSQGAGKRAKKGGGK